MNNQFTPGPWTVSGQSIVAGNVCIATIEDDGGYEAPSEQRESNARLIAAAPELFEACRELLAHGSFKANGAEAEAAAQRAIAVIAKAEGK